MCIWMFVGKYNLGIEFIVFIKFLKAAVVSNFKEKNLKIIDLNCVFFPLNSTRGYWKRVHIKYGLFINYKLEEIWYFKNLETYAFINFETKPNI